MFKLQFKLKLQLKRHFVKGFLGQRYCSLSQHLSTNINLNVLWYETQLNIMVYGIGPEELMSLEFQFVESCVITCLSLSLLNECYRIGSAASSGLWIINPKQKEIRERPQSPRNTTEAQFRKCINRIEFKLGRETGTGDFGDHLLVLLCVIEFRAMTH